MNSLNIKVKGGSDTTVNVPSQVTQLDIREVYNKYDPANNGKFDYKVNTLAPKIDSTNTGGISPTEYFKDKPTASQIKDFYNKVKSR